MDKAILAIYYSKHLVKASIDRLDQIMLNLKKTKMAAAAIFEFRKMLIIPQG